MESLGLPCHILVILLLSVPTATEVEVYGCKTKCHCWSEGHEFRVDCSGKNLTCIPDLPKNTTDLDLGFNNIHLSNNCFSKYSKLQQLRLQKNNLQHIPGLAFAGLRMLKLLDLSGNSLKMTNKAYPQEVFQPLVKLETLFLHGNVNAFDEETAEYSYLDQTLKYLFQLRKLTMDGLFNRAFGPGFESLNITELSTSGFDGSCNIGRLTDETFTCLKTIEMLNLSNCNLKNISRDAIMPLQSIVSLDLSYNIDLGFRPLRNISYSLQFARNMKILNISKLYHTFGLSVELKIKDIEYLKNTTVTKLSVNSNRIGLMETNALMFFPPNLHTLSIQDNTFTQGPFVFQLGCLKKLKVLIADYQNVPHDSVLPVTLRNGDVDKHKVTMSPTLDSSEMTCSWLNGSTTPTFLDIHFPPILQTVYISGSNMYVAFGFLPLPRNSITYLDMSGNLLNKLQGPVLNCQTLQYLDISRNYCSNISKVFFSTAVNLEYLKASENYIGFSLQNDIEGEIFGHLKKLKYFDLSFNRIAEIPRKAFKNLHNILTLNLSYNSISSLNVIISHMVNISEIDIQQNNLRKLPKSITDHLGNIAYFRNISINMKDNPIDCSCGNLLFLKWMNENERIFEFLETYTCIDVSENMVPMKNFQQHVMNLEKNCPSYAWIIILATALLMGFLILVVGGLVYRHRWRLRHLYYMTKARYYGYRAIPDSEPIENYKYDAFISYASEDLRFIKDEVIEYLEKDKDLSLCIHQRDFLPGNAIACNIADAIQSSRKTVIILTRNYLKSTWCMYEFNMARVEGMYTREGKCILLMIMKESIPNKLIPLEMMELATTDSYIEYPADIQERELFWDRVYQSIKQ